MKEFFQEFSSVDATQRHAARGKYVLTLSSLEIPSDVLSMKYILGKDLIVHLKPLCFWNTFHNLERMFGNNPLHELALSHHCDLDTEWREVQEKKRHD